MTETREETLHGEINMPVEPITREVQLSRCRTAAKDGDAVGWGGCPRRHHLSYLVESRARPRARFRATPSLKTTFKSKYLSNKTAYRYRRNRFRIIRLWAINAYKY